jgi:hypothetical protein
MSAIMAYKFRTNSTFRPLYRPEEVNHLSAGLAGERHCNHREISPRLPPGLRLTPTAKNFSLAISMKQLLPLALLLAAGVVFAGCSDTNDRGVIINHPFDVFGASATRLPANPPVPSVNSSTSSPAPSV